MNRLVLALLSASVLAPSAFAQSPHDPSRLFPFEADLSVPASASMVRLPLPAEVLARARPDLSDVRVHDSAGGEVPYLVDSGARGLAQDRPTELVLAPLSVVREGIRLPLPVRYRERLVFATPIEPPVDARWELSVAVPASTFVATMVVTRVRGEEREELARTTVFRLQDPLRERLGVELPALAPGDERIELLLESEQGYLSPEVRVVVSRAAVPAPSLRVGLEEIGRRRAEGRTVIELLRPPGLTPDRIGIVSDGTSFHRPIRVLDVRQGRVPVPLGEGAVYRVAEIAGAEVLELDVSATRRISPRA
ncbi:MAG: DUF3999 domain-containing protein, partial [Sandaracinaceae bacterium]|nr:DUF3999 domain-containing protein [Sandaracinaceae bacterium]